MIFMNLLLILFVFVGCTANPKYMGTTTAKNIPVKKRYYNQYSNMTDPNKKYPKETRETFFALCSYYGKKFHGNSTANGEIYDMHKMTCAHKTLPFNTILRITDTETNKSIEVRINDRGPFIPGRDVDLSYAAAKEIGLIPHGVKEYKIEVLQD